MKKQIFRILFLCAVVVAAVSCSNDDDPQVLPPEIKVDETAMEIDGNGGKYKIPYTVANLVEGVTLEATPEASWIQGLEVNSQQVVFTVEKNTSGAERQSAILLEYPGAESVTVIVKQLYNPAEITLSTLKTECDYQGGEFSFTASVKNPVSGTELEVDCEADWIQDLKLEEKKVSFTVLENNSEFSRNGRIVLTYGESTASYLVVQSYSAAEIKVKSSQICEDKGGDYTIAYTISNPRQGATLAASCEADWVQNLTVGEESVSFNVLPNEDAERTTVIKLSYKTASDVEITLVQEETAFQYTSENLSTEGTANCYIVSASGDYRLKAVKGNGVESVGEIASVEVLWESLGTEVAPQVGDLVKDPRVVNNFVEFTVSDPFTEGNALIAAKDESGKILWSWHIWLTDQPADQVYNNGVGTLMDRNLGATSATPGEAGTMGLLYQWGRKDPFMGLEKVAGENQQASTIVWPSVVNSEFTTGTMEYATENPTTFILTNYSTYDWYFTEDNTRWQTAKTVYDPCPVGYRVPEGGEEGVWAKAFGTSEFLSILTDKERGGFDFGALSDNVYTLTDSPVCWYPGGGSMEASNGYLAYRGSGMYWSCTPEPPRSAYCLRIYDYGGLALDYGFNRATGMSVRCVKE